MDADSLKLISRFLDGALDDRERVEMENRVLRDADFRDELASWSLTHRQIQELLEEQRLHGLLDSARDGARLLPLEFTSSVAGRNAWPKIVRRSMTIAVAALVLFAVGLGLIWKVASKPFVPSALPTVNEVASQPVAKERTSNATFDEGLRVEPAPRSVATLTRLSACQWVPGTIKHKPGTGLTEGARLQLSSGLAKVTFECGAEIVLQGPCDFSIIDAMRGFLHGGRLTANVPPRAFAFSISSPGVDFADLGTEFGVSVGEDSTAELHVFSGEVIYRMDAAAKQSNDVVHVAESEAVRLRPPAGGEESIRMDRSLFLDPLKLGRPVRKDLPLPVTTDLALWLSASDGVDVDANHGVIAWHDSICGDNVVGEDALQPEEVSRPDLLPHSVNGRPGIRFNGTTDYLVTTPIESTSDQTVIIVGQYSDNAFDGKRKYGGQIINYDGPPSRELSNTFKPGILQIGEPLLEEEFVPTLVSGQVFAGFAGKATIEAGRIDGHDVGANRPFLLTYRYDYTQRRSTMFVDGVQVGEGNAFAPAALTSRKVIGRHAWMDLFFHGDLAELLVFNAALTDSQLAKLTDHLQSVYGLVSLASAVKEKR